MHTTCPECSSVFRVTAEQLNIAHGQVRCGYCQTVFDALGTLEDDWKDNLPGHEDAQAGDNTEHVVHRAEDNRSNSTAENATEQSPGSSQHNQDDESSLLHDLLSDNDDDGARPVGPSLPEDEPSALAELQAGNGTRYISEAEFRKLSSNDIKQQVETLFGKLQDEIHERRREQAPTGEKPHNIEHLQTSSRKNAKMEEIIADDRDTSGFILQADKISASTEEGISVDTPHILREELAAITGDRASRYTFVWFVGIVLLVVALLLQGLYYFRDELARHEDYRGLVVSMCDILSCEVPLRNDAQEGIKTMVMRSHAINPVPGQDDQLQINAVFTNTAAYRQAYPQLSVQLTDESGKVTAMRRFLPHEYLGSHIDIKQGLPANTSIEVIFNIIKPQTPVISYQLDFL
jgi:predicted Zn finger-like uncharacterized protein